MSKCAEAKACSSTTAPTAVFSTPERPTSLIRRAPFGLAGIPAITLTQGYADADATWPGNATFHTVNDTPDKITNRSLWLKAAKLTLATALELALSD